MSDVKYVAAKSVEFPDSQSLRVHVGLFTTFTSARVIVAYLLATVAVRLTLGPFQWRELIGPAIILLLEPFVEWTIHVVLLHFKPRPILGKHRDPCVARKHRAHHAAPREVGLVLLPTRVPVLALPIAALVTVVLGRDDPRAAATTLAFGYLMLLTYEWTHFLIHSKYRPRRWYYRTIWRNHRNHHFRNENYWFGVTMDIGDRVLRTAPAKDAVPLSPTARTVV
jgi:sterol desaturase/sphingolipid hydroxylase (fatty acid hydroxylase superfamily)